MLNYISNVHNVIPDVDEFEDLATEFDVTSLPHIVFFDNSVKPSGKYSYVGSDINIILERVKGFIEGNYDSNISAAAIEPAVPEIDEIIFESTHCLALPILSVPVSSIFIGDAASNESRVLVHVLRDLDPTFDEHAIFPSAESQNVVASAFTSSVRISSDIDRIKATVGGGMDFYDVSSVRELYTYQVPTLNAAGTCSNLAQLAKRPFSLAGDVYHISDEVTSSDEKLTTHPLTQRLQCLNNAVNQLRFLTGADWIGIYRMVRADGDIALVKEAYLGEPSRPVFPVTEAFAQKSTNSWVALTARGRSIPDTNNRGAGVTYYECSGRVQSELCVPILRRRKGDVVSNDPINCVWEVVGIIDLESWKLNHFHLQMICDVMKVALDLGSHDGYAVLPK